LDSSLASNENFSETLLSSGWALGQITSMGQNGQKPTSLMTSLKKKKKPKPKIFSLETQRLAQSFEGLNSSLAQSLEELCSW